jgi:UDP-GlcNAc3NAcA epimerase
MGKRLTLMRIVGTRPQFMQAAVLRREFDRRSHKEILVHTGQHYDAQLSKVFFDDLGMPAPDLNLGIGSASHGAQTGRMLEAIEHVLQQHPCDAVVVDGDTNSTLAGALAAAKLHIPLIHVEAGLRSFDRAMPEEVNRTVTDHLADLLCAPTQTAVTNLVQEGLATRVVRTGDLMYDCFLAFGSKAKEDVLRRLGVEAGGYLLATVHRAENTDDRTRFHSILAGLVALPLPVIFPVHPRALAGVERFAHEYGGLGALRVHDPLGYLDMLALERHACCIFTDSGGVQREAFFAGVPSVVLRHTTEWVEQVSNGWSVLVSGGGEDILAAYQTLQSRPRGVCTSLCTDIYGHGDAARRVADAIEGSMA